MGYMKKLEIERQNLIEGMTKVTKIYDDIVADGFEKYCYEGMLPTITLVLKSKLMANQIIETLKDEEKFVKVCTITKDFIKNTNNLIQVLSTDCAQYLL
eukprot:gene6976-11142_t